MSAEHKENKMNLNDEILLTSLALGELEGDDLRTAESLIATDVSAKAYFDEMVGLTGELTTSMAQEVVPGLDPSRRAVIEKVTQGAEVKHVSPFNMDLRPFAVAAGLILAIAGAISFNSKSYEPIVDRESSEVIIDEHRTSYSLKSQKNVDRQNNIASHGVAGNVHDSLNENSIEVVDLFSGHVDEPTKQTDGSFIGFSQDEKTLMPGPAGEASALATLGDVGEPVGPTTLDLQTNLKNIATGKPVVVTAGEKRSRASRRIDLKKLAADRYGKSKGGSYKGASTPGGAGGPPVRGGSFAPSGGGTAGSGLGPAGPASSPSGSGSKSTKGYTGGVAGGVAGGLPPADAKKSSHSGRSANTSTRRIPVSKPDASKARAALGSLADKAIGSKSVDLPNLRVKKTAEVKAVLREANGVTPPTNNPTTLGVEFEMKPANSTTTLYFDARSRDLAGESYANVKENDFAMVGVSPLSTIGLDVDTASYANVRRHLEAGQWPPRNAVRVDEMVNYFHYEDPLPEDDEPLRVHAEVAACPWNLENRLLRIGFRAKTIDREARGPSNLVFLVDVSGSMKSADKLPLLVRGLKAMVNQLGEDDRVAIVTYSGSSGLALPATRGSEKSVILSALDRLAAGGSTNGASGIDLAYRTATENFDAEGVNRVILCTDGDFNVGVSDTNALITIIKDKAATGVFLSVLGFGSGNIKDDKMEALANKGNGHYAYIDGDKEAQKVLVEELEGTLITVAKDCKLQVEFNPAEVSSYRLLGYTARQLAAADFNDDTKDGGEIGAGHSVVALYEIRPANGKDGGPKVDPLKYQKQVAPTDVGAPGELATVKVRYKMPDEAQSRVRLLTVLDKGAAYDDASTDFKLSSSVALFGMLLSHSPFAGQTNFDTAFELALASLGKDNDPRGLRKQLCGLIQAAKVISNQAKKKGQR
ncbi:MAG: Ca-activated chloride channel family protein [Planctomycetota bacterium]|jgi:Ca-activated chloride channel family protein